MNQQDKSGSLDRKALMERQEQLMKKEGHDLAEVEKLAEQRASEI